MPQESEARFRLMANGAPVPLWMADLDAKCVFFNDTWLKFTGRTLEQEYGDGWAEGVHHEDLQRCMDIYLSNFNARKAFEMEYRLRRADGEYRWVLDRGAPYFSLDGTFMGFIGSCMDVTEIRQAREAALDSAKIKSEFLAVMSHEIRTPLNAILGMGELLLKSKLPQQTREYIDSICRAGRNLLGIANDVLDFSKIESGGMILEIGEMSLKKMADDMIKIMETGARAKHLRLGCQVDERIPALLKADEKRLRQVLTNLVGNAIKFTEKGGIELRFTMEKETVGWVSVLIEVQDTGIGISADSLKRDFEAFYQADSSASRKFSGTGLGLAINHKIVEFMGGEIGARSVVGEGSTFWVKLNLEKTHVRAAAVKPAKAPAKVSAKKVKSAGRLLAVEDDELSQKLMLAQMKNLGYQVDAVSDGHEALKAAMSKPYEIIFLDCMIPGMDGYAVAESIRKSPGPNQDTPIVATTAKVLSGDKEKCLAAGMNDYLPKPFSLNDLASTIDRCLS